MPEHYLGIDVGWSSKKDTTGLCLITLDQDGFRWECRNTGTDRNERRKALRDLIPKCTTLYGVGIDGPLARGLWPITHYRAAEALLTGGRGYVFQSRCQSGKASDKRGQDLNREAIELAELVLELQEEKHLELAEAIPPHRIHRYRIVEAFPNAFLAFLLSEQSFPPKEQIDREKSDIYWEIVARNPFLLALTEPLDPECTPNLIRTLAEHLATPTRHQSYLRALIEHLAPGRYLARPLESIISHNHRAAFVCALTALCASKQQYVAAGDPKYGYFYLPPVEVWGSGPDGRRSWAENPLREKVNSVHTNRIHPSHGHAKVICNGDRWM